MDFERFREMKGWTLERAADAMRSSGIEGLATIDASTVARHERGILFPRPDVINGYAELTEGAVSYDDWARLREQFGKGKGQKPPRPRGRKTRSESAEKARA